MGCQVLLAVVAVVVVLVDEIIEVVEEQVLKEEDGGLGRGGVYLWSFDFLPVILECLTDILQFPAPGGRGVQGDR